MGKKIKMSKEDKKKLINGVKEASEKYAFGSRYDKKKIKK